MGPSQPATIPATRPRRSGSPPSGVLISSSVSSPCRVVSNSKNAQHSLSAPDERRDALLVAVEAQQRPAISNLQSNERAPAQLARGRDPGLAVVRVEGAGDWCLLRHLARIVHLEPGFKSRPDLEQATLTIGELAAAGGVNTSAVRYYERRGLMPEPVRISGQRRYDQPALARLRTIRAAQQAGLSLDEVGLLLAGADDGASAEALRLLAERKLPNVEALIERAQTMKQWLELAADCRCESLDVCDLFASDYSIGSRAPRLVA